jgi:ABC-type uncharacterized transport system substrate-binding protein
MKSALASAITFCAALILAWTPPVQAHPHGWISVKTRLVIDDDNRALRLHQTWTFDALYTAFVLEGVADTPELAAQVIRDVAAENLQNLGEYAYFTEIRLGGAPLATETAVDLTTNLVDHPGGAKLQMAFTLPLSETADLTTGTLVYAVFDPSFYIDMRHDMAADATLDGGTGCALDMQTNEPSADIVDLAASMDEQAVPVPSLGRHFAQFVEVRCP